VKQPTKTCNLTVHLRSGVKISGLFHVPLCTGSKVRPGDALREKDSDFMLFSDVTISEGPESSRQQQAVLVNRNAITYIELPGRTWDVRL